MPEGQELEFTVDKRAIERRKDKVCIVGCADSKTITPFARDDMEFWGVNNLYGVNLPGAHWDRWFEIHNIERDPDGKFRRREDLEFRGQPVDEYLKGLAKLDCPVIYMQKHWDEVPNSIEYPLGPVTALFGRYFTNSISYQIALAILMGYEEIAVYGVDMAVGCLAPETRVLTSDLRWVRSGDVELGDELMAFDEESSNGDGKTRRWRTTRVTANPEIKKPSYRVRFEDGTEIVASEKHGWLTKGENTNRWKTTDELVTSHHRGGRPTRVIKLVEVCEPDNSWESGYIAAAFDGEGYLSQYPRKDHVGSYAFSLGFAQQVNPMLDMVETLLKAYGYDAGVGLPNGGETVQLQIRGGKPEVIRFLSQFRPRRLMRNFNPNVIGELQAKTGVAVTGIEFLGEQTVMGLETDAKTYVAEGFASHNSEYAHQRPSCEFFLGWAMGRGIKIFIPDEADLLKSRFMYGFEERKRTAWQNKMRKVRADLQHKRAAVQQRMDADKVQFHQYIGAEYALGEMEKIWSNLDDPLPVSS